MSHIPYYGEDWDTPAPPKQPPEREPKGTERGRPAQASAALWARPAVRGAYFL